MLDIQEKTLGELDDKTMDTRDHLAEVLHEAGDAAAAAVVERASMLAYQQKFGRQDVTAITIKVGYAANLIFVGVPAGDSSTFDEAWQLLQDAKQQYIATLGYSHPDTINHFVLMRQVEQMAIDKGTHPRKKAGDRLEELTPY